MSTPEQELQASRFRRSVGLDITDISALPTTEVNDIFAQAAERYEDSDSSDAYARIIYIEGLFASSAKMATYKKNQTTENVSDIFEHVARLLVYWSAKLLAAINENAGLESSARFGKTKQIPTRWKEYPNC